MSSNSGYSGSGLAPVPDFTNVSLPTALQPIPIAVIKNVYDAENPTARLVTSKVNTVFINLPIPVDGNGNFDVSANSVIDASGNIDEKVFFHSFYNPGGTFGFNAANYNTPVNILGNYVVHSTNGLYNFNLYQSMIESYTKLNSLSFSDIDTATLIMLRKECSVYQSLSNFHGSAYGLSFGDIISLLITDGVLKNNGVTAPTPVPVPLQIELVVYSAILDMELHINIIYMVNMSLKNPVKLPYSPFSNLVATSIPQLQ
jgi:hypothetical protein